MSLRAFHLRQKLNNFKTFKENKKGSGIIAKKQNMNDMPKRISNLSLRNSHNLGNELFDNGYLLGV